MRRYPPASPGLARRCPRPTRRFAHPFLLLIAATTLLATGLSSVAGAAQVGGIQARYADGQTFITWLTLPGDGWTYRIYKASAPIRTPADLLLATTLGSVGDSTWCDRRLSSLTGEVYGYRTEATARPLNFVRSLFVTTVDDAQGTYYYAVTAQARAGVEDRTLREGENSLDVAVAEAPARPRPVFQHTLTIGTLTVDVYTLWTSNHVTPSFPEMSNRESTPYDCAVVRGAEDRLHALVFRPHVRGGNFLQVAQTVPGEWSLTMDDYLGTSDQNTFWFGYHEGYDIESNNNVPPLVGTVRDYTMQRVIFTLEWARSTLPIDPGRTYVNGSSMGGICGVFLAMRRPDLVAAAMLNVPRFDFSSEGDPNVPVCAFNSGGGQRATCDRLWGTVDANLPMENGTPVFSSLNAGLLARGLKDQYIPPIIAFSGRNDFIVGWAEKIPFYQAMKDTRAGGTFYWDNRDHWSTETSAWRKMLDYAYLYRYRTDRSFPALSNCSADQNPGNGMSTSGDSVGTINGWVEWDENLVDEVTRWQVTLHSRILQASWGPIPAPELVTVDVTPRRLQHFATVPYGAYVWTVRRMNGTVVTTGTVTADEAGLVTVPGVPVFREGNTLQIQPAAFLGVELPLGSRGAGPVIANFPTPIHGSFSISVTWAHDGDATLDLVDLTGRQVRHIDGGTVAAGPRSARVDANGLASGIYFLTARQAGVTATKRLALLR